MVEAVKIAAQPRQRAGKGAARATRRAGRVPAVIYGEKQAPQLIDLDPKELTIQIQKAGQSFFTRVFDVQLNGGAIRVLPRDVQLHPVTDKAEHVDFMRVGEHTRIRVSIPVEFANKDRSPGLKRGGVLNVVRHAIEVYCTVDNIPQIITVDLDGLDIGDSVHISAVKLPEGVKPTIARNFTVAAVAAPSVLKSPEEEAAEAAAKAAAAAPVAGEPGAAAPAAGAAAPAPGAAAGAKGAAPAAAPAAAGGKAPAKK
jgi:large subunit ribosomal protein L25